MDTLGSINEKTRQAYNLAAEKYHSLFHDEMKEKEYDRKLLDAFGNKFAPGSLIADAGCGPSAHIGRYLFDKGMKVFGIDISDHCVELAARFNPEMQFQ
jgi:2-polyprenyl-3-methyl-5-hydroxy-6-metoxy-1,4-benzoquinol methylase